MADASQQIKRVDPLSKLALTNFVSSEKDAIKQRQQSIEAEISELTKKLAGLKETFLVLSGAIQGLEHVDAYLRREAEGGDGAKPPPAPAGGEGPPPETRHLKTPVPGDSKGKPRPV